MAILSFTGLAVTLAFSEQTKLIDFNDLKVDDQSGEHTLTELDYSSQAGTSFNTEDKAEMKISLAVKNWDVELNPSARSIVNEANSMTKPVVVSENAERFMGRDMANTQVMGVRVLFPKQPFNASARIIPPFEMPAYDGLDLKKFDSYGVVKNVGVLKKVQTTVYGSNFPVTLGLLLTDDSGIERELKMGDLEFDGWKTLVWENPNYIENVRNREIRKFPLYPNAEPFVKFAGFVIYRDSLVPGGDVVAYFRDVQLTYDLAVLESQRDIEHDAQWGIVKERTAERQRIELQRLGNQQVLQYLESRLMDTTPEDDDLTQE